LKDKIDEKIAEGAQTKRHVKLGYGGIREIEFIVQTLQLELGRKKVEARERNTLRTLRKLARNGALSPEARRRLSAAYLFLRDVENKLQMAHDLQTHLLPTEPAEFRRLALRLGYRDGVGSPAPDQLTRDYRFHTETVHALFQELFETPEGLRK
ncbi:MAG TPA: putative nucleotidyltransferase substrate binding domain-containing protein, partial [Candidatus Manganitrophaceae bacterium]|nr:putative nucleotidyltransferase substrate binding domain-containing protein [Candidatus Manganitrophaceae bacterium]